MSQQKPIIATRHFEGRGAQIAPQLFQRTTGAEALAMMLRDLGVRYAFGIVGGAISKFTAALALMGIEVVHTQHETGAVFMASEAYFVSGQPCVVFATTGPGASNTITGLLSAVWDGAKVVCVVAGTDADGRGRGAFQETRAEALNLTPWVGACAAYMHQSIDTATQLLDLSQKLAVGLARPGGFVASLAFTMAAQAASIVVPRPLPEVCSSAARASSELISELCRRLLHDSFVIWLGHGARHSSAEVLEFAERSGAMVMCSPRAKGVFPETHPQSLGVTGMFGSHVKPLNYFRDRRPNHVLVLGSRLCESTSGFDADLAPRQSFIHVDLDCSVFKAAYPTVPTLGVQAEIKGLLQTLLELWPMPAGPQRSQRTVYPQVPLSDAEGIVHPRALMAAIQRVVVDGSEAMVLADLGNSFAWANLELRFEQPGRYRTSSGFGAMTSAVCGVVGSALARRSCAVAIVGDGAMLMNNELSTSVRLGVDSKWIVLNDSSYGMVRHGMESVGIVSFATDISSTDFVRLAEALGASGLRVSQSSDLDDVLQLMLDTPGPVVVDVRIDPRPAPPFGRRNLALDSSWSRPP